MDHRIQIKLLDHLVKRNAVDFRDYLCITDLLGIQRQQNILLVDIRQRRKALIPLQSLFFEQITICTVSADNRCFWNTVTELFASPHVFFHNFDANSCGDQHLCKIKRNRASTDDHDIFHLVGNDACLLEKLICL